MIPKSASAVAGESGVWQMNRIRLLVGLLWIALTVPCVIGADTLEQVEQRLIETVGRHRNWCYRYEHENILDGTRWWERMEGIVEYERIPGGGYLYRMERRFQSYKKDDAGKEHRIEGEFIAVCDGKHIYNYQDVGGERRVLRFSLDAFPNPCDYRTMFAAQRQENTLRLLPDAVVDGQPVYVIESIPLDRRNTGAARTVWYFAKQNGLTVRNVTEDILGNPTQTAIASDIRIDVDIPRSRFEFQPPAGVEIQDANPPAARHPATSSQPASRPAAGE